MSLQMVHNRESAFPLHVCISSLITLQASHPSTGAVFRDSQWTYVLRVSIVFPWTYTEFQHLQPVTGTPKLSPKGLMLTD